MTRLQWLPLCIRLSTRCMTRMGTALTDLELREGILVCEHDGLARLLLRCVIRTQRRSVDADFTAHVRPL